MSVAESVNFILHLLLEANLDLLDGPAHVHSIFRVVVHPSDLLRGDYLLHENLNIGTPIGDRLRMHELHIQDLALEPLQDAYRISRV